MISQDNSVLSRRWHSLKTEEKDRLGGELSFSPSPKWAIRFSPDGAPD